MTPDFEPGERAVVVEAARLTAHEITRIKDLPLLLGVSPAGNPVWWLSMGSKVNTFQTKHLPSSFA